MFQLSRVQDVDVSSTHAEYCLDRDVSDMRSSNNMSMTYTELHADHEICIFIFPFFHLFQVFEI